MLTASSRMVLERLLSPTNPQKTSMRALGSMERWLGKENMSGRMGPTMKEATEMGKKKGSGAFILHLEMFIKENGRMENKRD